MTDVYIYDVVRTPRGRGKSDGALYEVKPVSLLSSLLKALQERNQFTPEYIDDCIIGCATPTGDQGFNIARSAILNMGWKYGGGGTQINRSCTSGLEAINMAAAKIQAGWDELILAGGIESMSRVPLGSDGGPLMFDPDTIIKSHNLPQGVAADLVATVEGYTREQLDEYALLSHQRAKEARAKGYFNNSLVPILDQSGLVILAEDEFKYEDTDAEGLAQLPPAFTELGEKGFNAMALHSYPIIEKIQHLHTAGNACANVDGAALALVASARQGKVLGLKPRARIRIAATATVDPTIMFTGPVPATQKALRKAGMTVDDIDLWECNEAFAAVVLKFQQDMGIPMDKLNVNGGAIALGHPMGATGAILLNVLLDELERRDLNTGLLTLCAGAGLAVATIIERV